MRTALIIVLFSTLTPIIQAWGVSPLSLTLDQLGLVLGGKGRAQSCWDCYRLGVDPLNTADDEEREQRNLVLGKNARKVLQETFGSVEERVSRLNDITVCQDGTTKLLLDLTSGLQVETVILPFSDRQRSTLCISSQVGCRQACTFCLTGRMGLLQSLSVDEILSQVYWAAKVCRTRGIYPIDNIVFMGLGVSFCSFLLKDRELFLICL
jgi:23S rRNA (adenine2503-C2)-methyltransferase